MNSAAHIATDIDFTELTELTIETELVCDFNGDFDFGGEELSIVEAARQIQAAGKAWHSKVFIADIVAAGFSKAQILAGHRNGDFVCCRFDTAAAVDGELLKASHIDNLGTDLHCLDLLA